MSAKYLGEQLIDISSHPEFSIYKEKDWAMYFITAYGQIDGSHHKTWVLDQVARILKGTPVIVKEARWDNGNKEYRVVTSDDTSEEYKAWRIEMLGKQYEEDDPEGWYEKGEYEYGYDEGIAP